MHKADGKRRFGKHAAKDAHKTVVLGVLERGGEVRNEIVPRREGALIRDPVRKHTLACLRDLLRNWKGYDGLAAFNE